MTDIYVPAPSPQIGSTESAAPQVTTQETTPSAGNTPPPAETPSGSPQAAEPAGQTSTETASDQQQKADQSQEEPKTWKEKRAERNRQRWNEFKEAKQFTARRLESLEREVYQLRSQQAPDLSRITDPDEQLAQRTAWTVQQQQAAQREQQLKAERERAIEDQNVSMHRAWAEHAEEARQRFADFDQVFNETVPVHARAVPHIVESEKGAEIAYYLGKNLDVARSLADQFERNPAQALIELGRIEARITAPAPKQVSTAPRPAPALNGGVSPLAFDAHSASVDDVAKQLKKAGIIR